MAPDRLAVPSPSSRTVGASLSGVVGNRRAMAVAPAVHALETIPPEDAMITEGCSLGWLRLWRWVLLRGSVAPLLVGSPPLEGWCILPGGRGSGGLR